MGKAKLLAAVVVAGCVGVGTVAGWQGEKPDPPAKEVKADPPKPEPPKPVAEAKPELAKFQGVWKVVTIQGQPPVGPTRRLDPERYTLVVAGDDFAFQESVGKVRPAGDGKSVDLEFTHGPRSGHTLLGCYSVSGDALELAAVTRVTKGVFGLPRPVSAKLPEREPGQLSLGGPHFHYAFERDAAATPERTAGKLKEMSDKARAFVRPPLVSGVDRPTEELLREVIDRLDRMEKRLDELEKKK